MHFTRERNLLSDIFSDIFQNKKQDITVFLSDGLVHVDKILLHILSSYKFEDKTDAIFIPDLNHQQFSDLIKGVFVMEALDQVFLDDHKYWLDLQRFSAFEELNERKKKKRSNFRNFESNKQISKIKCYTKVR